MELLLVLLELLLVREVLDELEVWLVLLLKLDVAEVDERVTDVLELLLVLLELLLVPEALDEVDVLVADIV